jgi:hypothetical protein
MFKWKMDVCFVFYGDIVHVQGFIIIALYDSFAEVFILELAWNRYIITK